ncbi:hypothetical protein TNCV_1323971 [Trichonephila clavipes]|nr:hypothetical protein TNCV_1323971 [Trichonephila clavipes]
MIANDAKIVVKDAKLAAKKMPTWLYRQDFAKFSLNHHYNALNRRFLLGVWTVNSPQSHIVRVYDAGHGKSGVFPSAEWHDGDWSSDGIREAWLWFFIWVESF